MASRVTIRQVPYRKGQQSCCPNKRGQHYHVEGDERIEPSVPLDSCSSIAKYASPSGDGLIYWGVDLALATGRRDAFKESNERALAIGKAIHDEIAEHIATGKEPANPSPIFGKWFSSMQEQGLKWLACERMVYHRKLGYAGTYDALGIVDDEVTLFDWKTTNGLNKEGRRKKLGYSDHAAQVAGYILAMSSLPPDPEVPIPTKAVICYLLKDVREVVWLYIDIKAAKRAFLASYRLYTADKGGLYETR